MSKSFRGDLTGQRFERLTVLEFVPNDKPLSFWKCQCDCGNIIIARRGNLITGHTKSCGCWSKEQAKKRCTKHGGRNTRLYKIWSHMKGRCLCKTDHRYKDYGGRGISVCEEWLTDFAAFKKWALEHGYSEELTIDRIDVNGNYEPDNCRWADIKTQNRNRRSNIIVEFKGEKMCLTDVARIIGVTSSTLELRYKKGERDERLFRAVKRKSK